MNGPCRLELLRNALLLLAANACASTAATRWHDDITTQLAANETHVFVSRELVRVVFPPVPDFLWRVRPTSVLQWRLEVPGTPGPAGLVATIVYDDSLAAMLPDLDRIVRSAGHASCGPSTFVACGNRASVRAVHNRMVISLTDTFAIRKLFAFPSRMVSVHAPGHNPQSGSNAWTLVPVQYLEPRIPEPDSLERQVRAEEVADALRSERSIIRSMSIVAGDVEWSSLWLHVGDTAALYASEARCRLDLCLRDGLSGTWSSSDSSKVAMRPAEPRLGMPPPGHGLIPPEVVITATQLGRAVISVAGLPEAPRHLSRSVPPTTVTGVVTVIPRIGSLSMVPLRDTIFAWEPVKLVLEVRDETGSIIPDIPVTVLHQAWTDTALVIMPRDGTRDVRIVATFKGWSDTAVVHVIDSGSADAILAQYEDSSAQALLRLDRERVFGYDLLTRTLRAQTRLRSEARLDSLADSLMTRALTRDTIGLGAYRARMALSVLQHAGSRHAEGRTYRGAFERIVRVHRESPSVSLRDAALAALAYQSNAREASRYLEAVATGLDGPLPLRAIVSLTRGSDVEMTESEAALRRLWRAGTVTDSDAADALRRYAWSHGWRNEQKRRPPAE